MLSFQCSSLQLRTGPWPLSRHTRISNPLRRLTAPAPDIRRRAAAARETRHKSHRPLITNAFLSTEERLVLHWFLVIHKFLHGAGLWTCRHAKDVQAFSAAYASLVRPICLPVFGVPAKGLDDDFIVCAICGFPNARLLRDMELVSAAVSIGHQS